MPATTVFTDVSTIVNASAVSASHLSTVTLDQAAVQKDLTNLSPYGGGGGGYGFKSSVGIGEGQAATASTSASRTSGSSPAARHQYAATDDEQQHASCAGADRSGSVQTELQSLASKTGVTVGDLTQLSLDSQALDIVIRGVSSSALQQAVSDLASAATGRPPSLRRRPRANSRACSDLGSGGGDQRLSRPGQDRHRFGRLGDGPRHRCADEATIQADLTSLQLAAPVQVAGTAVVVVAGVVGRAGC